MIIDLFAAMGAKETLKLRLSWSVDLLKLMNDALIRIMQSNSQLS